MSDLKKYMKDDMGMTAAQIADEFTKVRTECATLKIPEKELDVATEMRIRSRIYRKKKMGVDVFEGFLIGIGKQTDFAAKRRFDTHYDSFLQDPEQAISDGIVDSDGNPLWGGDGSRAKQRIEPEREISIPIVFFGKKKESKHSKPMIITAFFKKNMVPESWKLFVASELNGVINDNKSNDEAIVLKTNEALSVRFLSETQEDFAEIVKKHLASKIVQIKDLRKIVMENTDLNYWCIVDGWVQSQSMNGVDVNMVKVAQLTGMMNGDSDTIVTGFAPKTIPFNFIADSNVLLIGRPRISSKDDELTMDVYGIYVPEYYQMKVSGPVLEPEVVEEKEDW